MGSAPAGRLHLVSWLRQVHDAAPWSDRDSIKDDPEETYVSTMLRRPSAPLFAPKTVTGPHGAVTLAARERRVAPPHWHLIGDYFRPLHEQLAALNDSRRWAAVVAEGSARMPLATAGLSLRSEGMTLTTVQRGLDYAVVAVAGDIDGPATQHVRCQIRPLLDVGVRHLVVSLSDVLSCDSEARAVDSAPAWARPTSG